MNHVHDGVGERLINLNPTVLNNPALRTAGWVPDAAAIKRCHSPPIPTGNQHVRNKYFNAPRRATDALEEYEGDGERGGMVTGNHGSEDTLEPAAFHGSGLKRERRRRKEQLEEDDSSDLSDDSDEDDKGPAQSIMFKKMPMRNRAPSTPAPRENAVKDEMEEESSASILATPSRPPDSTIRRLRSGSSGAVEAIKQRARRDTTTSSDMSSENEIPSGQVFQRKLSGRPGKGPSMLTLEADIQEEAQETDNLVNSDLDDEDEDIDIDEASDLSDEFEGTVGSPSLLGIENARDSTGMSPSPIKISTLTPASSSPRKLSKDGLPKLPALPANSRPKSEIPPVSLITMMIKGNDNSSSNEKSFRRYAALSGEGEANPFWVKIYAPFSEQPSKPIEVALRRTMEDRPVTVAQLIGLALCRYDEEGYQPSLTSEESDINQWTLRIIEDEEIDFDFPALGRTRPVLDFTMNNSRPPQRRMKDKPWDEFGLVKATEGQIQENAKATPQMEEKTTPIPSNITPSKPISTRPDSVTSSSAPRPLVPTFQPIHNPITGPAFALKASRKDSSNLLDLPQRETRQGASRTGAPRTVIVCYTDPQSFITRNEEFPTTTDSYIAEIFDQCCKRLNLDKALYVLKVHGTQTVAPSDRTVEALGDKLRLDLVRRRFMGAGVGGGDGMFVGLGLSGSPGSTSPNAPLTLTPTNGTPKKKGMKGFNLHPLAAQQKSEFNATAASFMNLTATGSFGGEGKRYNVLRKQPLSFAGTHPRTVIITPEYMTIMPAAPDSLAAPTGKVTNVPMTSIIGAKVSRKHPKMVRILVFREKETKRYDFEAVNHREAEEMVADVRKGMEAFGPGVKV